MPEETEVGSYFVSNYPPFSFWRPEHLPAARASMGLRADPATALGLYLHIPFCRKRCKFCYFRVYTDKNAGEVEAYLDALVREIEIYSRLPVLQDRGLRFVYFGGGTPSFLSSQQLRRLADRLRRSISWEHAEEVTFECEPGTLQEGKVQALREIGVTRVSLGVENFDDAILAENGRAHLSREIYRAYAWIRDAGFPQVNIDLIAGMVGETWDNWRECVCKAIDLAPDSVTIYQMELPFNTLYSRAILKEGAPVAVASWATKRAWAEHAFRAFEDAGYRVSSAYTLVRGPAQFIYRDALWHGADMVGTGVASFSQVAGTHYQNVDTMERYVEALASGELPLARAWPATPNQQMIRELVLQLKLGVVDAAYFRRKFNRDILETYGPLCRRFEQEQLLERRVDEIRLTRQGLLRVDSLLPEFFETEHRHARTS
ncbi:MAG: coproporphyrinogen III oxidase family protein [Planctomycetes bacterium]|nr:coproporphyrinogen III oxidase family protein [Planctomycetota bacterium]